MKEQLSDLTEHRLLRMFKKDISNIPLLSMQEEYIVAKRAQANELEAINCLVESNLRFVIQTVFKFWHPGLPLMDLISEGCIGMIRATKTYDPERGFRFLTYAELGIKRGVWAAINNHYLHNHDSLDDPAFGDELEITKKDLIASDDPGADQNYFALQIGNLLNRLPERDKKVIELRFWHDKTLEEIGDIIGLTKDRVRQIEGRALRRLRLSIYEDYSGPERESLAKGESTPLNSF